MTGRSVTDVASNPMEVELWRRHFQNGAEPGIAELNLTVSMIGSLLHQFMHDSKLGPPDVSRWFHWLPDARPDSEPSDQEEREISDAWGDSYERLKAETS